MQSSEDSDLVLEGLAIVERDGSYAEGEMDGEFAIEEFDVSDAGARTSLVGGSWPGEVRRLMQTQRTTSCHEPVLELAKRMPT